MTEDDEEAVLRITDQYATEVLSGKKPRVSDYITRYPRYANAIADFVAYYHALELGDQEPVQLPSFQSDATATSSAGSSSTEDVVQHYQRRRRRAPARKHITSLTATAQEQGLTLGQVAASLDLSEDILLLLEQRLLEPATIPQAFISRIARVLHRSNAEVSTYITRSNEQGIAQKQREQPLSRAQVAEQGAHYSEGDAKGLRQSFRRAIENSVQLSLEQRLLWEALLRTENL